MGQLLSNEDEQPSQEAEEFEYIPFYGCGIGSVDIIAGKVHRASKRTRYPIEEELATLMVGMAMKGREFPGYKVGEACATFTARELREWICRQYTSRTIEALPDDFDVNSLWLDDYGFILRPLKKYNIGRYDQIVYNDRGFGVKKCPNWWCLFYDMLPQEPLTSDNAIICSMDDFRGADDPTEWLVSYTSGLEHYTHFANAPSKIHDLARSSYKLRNKYHAKDEDKDDEKSGCCSFGTGVATEDHSLNSCRHTFQLQLSECKVIENGEMKERDISFYPIHWEEKERERFWEYPRDPNDYAFVIHATDRFLTETRYLPANYGDFSVASFDRFKQPNTIPVQNIQFPDTYFNTSDFGGNVDVDELRRLVVFPDDEADLAKAALDAADILIRNVNGRLFSSRFILVTGANGNEKPIIKRGIPLFGNWLLPPNASPTAANTILVNHPLSFDPSRALRNAIVDQQVRLVVTAHNVDENTKQFLHDHRIALFRCNCWKDMTVLSIALCCPIVSSLDCELLSGMAVISYETKSRLWIQEYDSHFPLQTIIVQGSDEPSKKSKIDIVRRYLNECEATVERLATPPHIPDFLIAQTNERLPNFWEHGFCQEDVTGDIYGFGFPQYWFKQGDKVIFDHDVYLFGNDPALDQKIKNVFEQARSHGCYTFSPELDEGYGGWLIHGHSGMGILNGDGLLFGHHVQSKDRGGFCTNTCVKYSDPTVSKMLNLSNLETLRMSVLYYTIGVARKIKRAVGRSRLRWFYGTILMVLAWMLNSRFRRRAYTWVRPYFRQAG